MSRNEQIERAKNEQFDLCIIGGGITGAGILANALNRGLKVILIDKNDFASGTSSRSSKMIHGGLRYMKYAQFGMVREAVKERVHLMKLFPHLVKPMPFLLPSYHSFADVLIKDLALTVYDWYAGKSMPAHQRLNAKQVEEKLPGIKMDKLKGGIFYYDAWTNDARLTVDVIAEGVKFGAVALNYCEAKTFNSDNNEVKSVSCADNISGETISVHAKVFVNATGVWTDDVLQRLTAKPSATMQPSKGVHVVIPSARLPKECVAVVNSTIGEERMLYTLPWEHGLTILGATDTDYKENTDKIISNPDDVQYVLDAFNAGFPEAKITIKDAVCVFSGLRPILKEEDNKSNYSRSREYSIWWNKENMLTIAGGKLTSFLSMGNKCMNAVEEKFKSSPSAVKLFNEKSSSNWSETYGIFGKQIAEIINENPENASLLTNKYNYTKAEIIFFCRHQFAENVSDMLTRRTSITYAMREFDEALVAEVAKLMAKELKKDSVWIEEQKNEYHQHWTEYHPAFLTPDKN